MTPAINIAQKAKVKYRIHEYQHDGTCPSYGLEAAEKLAVPSFQVFKTLIVQLDNHKLVVGIIPVSATLKMKSMAKSMQVKKAAMALARDVERSTGYVLGGVSPLGQKKQLVTLIDASAQDYKTIFVSAGRRGVEIELSPHDLQKLTGARFARLC